MIDLFYKLYSKFCYNGSLMERTKINSVFRRGIQIVSNYVLPFYFYVDNKIHKHALYDTKECEGRIIASLTTFPARIDKLWIVVESILRQSRKPDKLILWLSEEQFPSIDSLPQKLLKLRHRGLEICLCQGDLRSHKKYYYVLKRFRNDHLFTFDDDIIYPSNTISSVLKVAEKNPNCVVGRYSNHIKLDEAGNVCFDRQFTSEYVNTPKWDTFIGSGGGTLYPAGSLPEIAMEDDVFMNICKTADDVWLNSMCRFNSYPVVATMQHCPLLEVLNRRNTTLAEVNYGAENYKQLKSVRDFCISKGRDPYKNL